MNRGLRYYATRVIFTTKWTSVGSRDEEGAMFVIHFRSNTHFRADMSIARFRECLQEMSIRQVPTVRPKAAVERNRRHQRFCEIFVRAPVATDRLLYR